MPDLKKNMLPGNKRQGILSVTQGAEYEEHPS